MHPASLWNQSKIKKPPVIRFLDGSAYILSPL
jgi:hypothetical protein